jgi:hypothetical protein
VPDATVGTWLVRTGVTIAQTQAVNFDRAHDGDWQCVDYVWQWLAFSLPRADSSQACGQTTLVSGCLRLAFASTFSVWWLSTGDISQPFERSQSHDPRSGVFEGSF